MALVVFDRVKETSNSTGTGTVVLDGAQTGYQSFAVVGNANTTYYTIAGQTTSEWEVGIGTYYTANTSLARTTILASSAANAAVTFSAGSKDVFITYPAERALYSNATGIPVFLDSTFTLQDETDASKQARFQLSGIAANNTVVYTLPAGSANASTLVDLATTQTISGAKTFSGATQNYGSSTANTTVNIAYGATLAANFKNINIGTGGVTGARANVTIGQANTTVTTRIYGDLILSNATNTGEITFPDGTVQATAAVAGLPVAGNSSIAIFNTNITANATIADGTNGLSIGPVTTANGVTVTIGANATWLTL